MRRRRWLAAAGMAGAAGVAAAARTVSSPRRRLALRRRLQLWRLGARRAGHFVRVRVRSRRATEDERARLDEQFAVRTAEDVAQVLGGMKGAIMKLGQLVSFVAEWLPEDARAALSALQADSPPMAPSLAASVVRSELGDDPERLFLEWDNHPVAAASIGQVHRAVLLDGRPVAVKVQYPGVAESITADLDNAEQVVGMMAATLMKGFDVKPFIAELRERMADEVDYRIEAANQQAFADRYAGHPFVHVPPVVAERSSRHVLTSEWVDGRTFDQFLAAAGPADRQWAAEVLFRWTMGCIYRYRHINGDPHPGNYRFHDGRVTFLDFGLVKRFDGGEHEALLPILDDMLAEDVSLLERHLVDAGFLAPDHGIDLAHLHEFVAAPYRPFMEDTFRYSPRFVSELILHTFDVQGPYGDVIRRINMPPSFVILQRALLGLGALLARLRGENRWGAILDEYRVGAPPATVLGELEAAWLASA